MIDNIKVIGFDADDTLWVNEPFYRETEAEFAEMMLKYGPREYINSELLKIEIANIDGYGYGIKSFILSMIETAFHLSNNEIDNITIQEIIALGKKMINKPVELLDGVIHTLEILNKSNYQLIVATKGDLLDQERKLMKSGIEKYFHHIEIMSDKTEKSYYKLLNHLDITPNEFLMVGNSMKSDILPVVKVGGCAVYVPYHTTWAYEQVEAPNAMNNFREISDISELAGLLPIEGKR